MSVRKFPYYLYHICRKNDKFNFSEGYIGVSNNPKKRWSSGGYKENPHLTFALKKYDDVIKYVIKIGTEKECLMNEKRLRPQKNMGWNIAVGGGKPPSPKGTLNCIGKLPKDKRRKIYTVTEQTRFKLSQAQQELKAFHSKRMLGEGNPMYGVTGENRPTFKGYYITPQGKFETSKLAAEICGVHRETIRRRCKVGGVIKSSKWQPKEDWGKTWAELGWDFEDKQTVGEKEDA